MHCSGVVAFHSSWKCGDGEKWKVQVQEKSRWKLDTLSVLLWIRCCKFRDTRTQLPKLSRRFRSWIITTCSKTIVRVFDIAKINLHISHHFRVAISRDSLINSCYFRPQPRQSTIGHLSYTISIIRISITFWWTSWTLHRVHNTSSVSNIVDRSKWMSLLSI